MPERFVFTDLRELFAKANEEKSGDQLAGIAAQSERERVAAKRKLADLTLAEIVQQPLIDPDDDDVSRLILETFDKEAFRRIKSMTVGGFREYILDDATGEAELKKLQWAIIPEIAAAVAKIMSNKDLVLAAREDPERDPVPKHNGRAWSAGHPRSAESSRRRHRRDFTCRLRGTALRMRRCGDRGESCVRFC